MSCEAEQQALQAADDAFTAATESEQQTASDAVAAEEATTDAAAALNSANEAHVAALALHDESVLAADDAFATAVAAYDALLTCRRTSGDAPDPVPTSFKRKRPRLLHRATKGKKR